MQLIVDRRCRSPAAQARHRSRITIWRTVRLGGRLASGTARGPHAPQSAISSQAE
ncbi:MAG TPA: hypothetical protein VGC15_12110 [Acetobacteraceae bacterium]